VLGFVTAVPCTTQESSPTDGEHGAIEGIARTWDGVPIEGAVIAANRTDASAPAALVRSEKDGRFHIADLLPGEYGLTATAPHSVAAFQGGVKLAARQTVGDIDLKFGKDGVTISGKVEDVNGQPLLSAQIEADRYSLFSGDQFYVYADDIGRYAITLPKATYSLSVKVEGYEGEAKTLLGNIDREADFSLAPAGKPGPAPGEITAWLKEHAIPLRTVEAGHGFADTQPLKQVIGDAQIVSLGEATHGTREFFQLKHRMFEFLVSQMGFTVFSIEANWPESLAVNDYVLNGKGDPAKALSGMYFWTWDTEEVLDMIRWMRQYNEDPTHVHKINLNPAS
jgi:erythromycin esterase